MTRLLTEGYQIVNKNFMAYESAWCGRYPVTVEIDRFKSDIGRQLCSGSNHKYVRSHGVVYEESMF